MRPARIVSTVISCANRCKNGCTDRYAVWIRTWPVAWIMCWVWCKLAPSGDCHWEWSASTKVRPAVTNRVAWSVGLWMCRLVTVVSGIKRLNRSRCC